MAKKKRISSGPIADEVMDAIDEMEAKYPMNPVAAVGEALGRILYYLDEYARITEELQEKVEH